MTNDPFYLIGRRADEAPACPVSPRIKASLSTDGGIRAENNGNSGALRTLGWSAATFGAVAILGWIIKEKFS